ncbi:MAG TPA: hypothetical protein VF807_08525 [Ktedonobacterales bacterium]
MNTSTKRQVLESLNFGKRIAEEESAELGTYFVETSQWRKIWAGEVDVVYGAKGAGKSAIYALLSKRADQLRERGIIVVAAENPRGTPVFKDLVAEAPVGTHEFRHLWKLYFLSLLAQELRDRGTRGPDGERVIGAIEDVGLLPRERNLRTLLRGVLDYVRRLGKIEAIEHSMQVDTMGGSNYSQRILLREPNANEKNYGLVSVDTLLQQAQNAFEACDTHVWLLLDRLDVAFADSDKLEQQALQALFHVYLDFQAYGNIAIKIFLRGDIWQRITTKGFREASHITRALTISWDEEALLHLVVRRSLRNADLRALYGVDEAEVMSSATRQRELFYRMFPEKVDLGAKKPTTFDWILSRTRDGSGMTAPRELIHLLSCIRDAQMRHIEVGTDQSVGDTLFDRAAIREALPEVSRVRLEQTLYAEYPKLKTWLERLDQEKTQQTPETLAKIWGVRAPRALTIAGQLTDIGFFERRGTKEKPVFWVPPLYRDALRMIQGAAE